MPKRHLKISAGFSIIEILIAVFLITIGLGGVMSLNNYSLQSQGINKNELVASQLAQEGLELVKNGRDAAWIPGFSGLGNLSNGRYIIDYRGSTTPVSGIDDAKTILKINDDGFYNHETGTSTQFRRMIMIYGDGMATTATSTIRFTRFGTNYFYEAVMILYNWGVGFRN